ncbi:WD40 repeat domain-containing serine/threonine protein kinase [Streptomyces beijiangensis]|uniref:Serine/threonine protein kinase n=1 Tax=Streptomyces beijiangensis TaxID=163361 RepID=A0A939JIH1_9ACTN|nr:serine/threonine-protein kinase [Streptomyces beijiangensis]MBO0515508.1 serine/threonine protein kinase [Streptomyces beijiangensis]
MRPVGSKYLLEEPLGRGATGTVWRARQRETAGAEAAVAGQPGEMVAIKVLKEELANDPDIVMRFLRERSVLLRLTHPNIVRTRDLVVEGDLLALVMDLIDGPDLHHYLRDNGPFSPVGASLLTAQIADALAASHADGVVHRDLKPGNVILAGDGPRIIDFGVAHAVGAADPMTRAGALIGTYAYMSPEQIRAEPLTHASDIFSLGSVLAFTSTGHSPFEASVVPAIVHRVTQEAPQLSGMHGVLYELTVACLEKNPYARPSATDVLERLSVTAPSAPPPNALPRRALVLGGVAAAATAVGGPAYMLWPRPKSASASKGHTGSPASPAARDITKPVMRLTGHTSTVGCLAFSPDGRTLTSGSFDGTLRLWDLVSGRTITTYKGHAQWAMAVAYSPDGTTLYSGSFDRTLRRWDVRTGVPKGILASYPGKFDSVNCLAFSPDGSILAAGVGNTVRLVEPSTGRTTATLTGHTGSMGWIAFSPDGKTLASVAADTKAGTVRYWDARTGRLIRTFTAGGTKNYSTVTFSPDGRTLTGAGPGLRLWDVTTGRLTATLTDHHGYLTTGVYRPDGALIAGAGGNREPVASETTGKTISLWDPSTGRLSATALTAVMPKSNLTASVNSLVFSPDGTTLAAAVNLAGVIKESDTSIQLWKLPGGMPIKPSTDGTHG